MTITVEDRAPTLPNFGTPMLFGYHTAWVDRLTKTYSSTDDMLTDGFVATDTLYKAAQILKSQSPSPDTFMIGRRVSALTQIVTLVPTITTQGFKYVGTIGGKAVSYTVLMSATLQTISNALVSLINGLSVGVTATNGGGTTPTITCTTNTAGVVVDYFLGTPQVFPELSGITFKDTTADTTTTTELPNVYKENSGGWYGLNIVDSSSMATILSGAAWTESVRKQYVAQTADDNCLDPSSTTDSMSETQNSAYSRTQVIYHRWLGGVEWLAVGWLAGALTTTPGSATMAFKVVAGCNADALSGNDEGAIFAKNGSDYTNITAGNPSTFEGKTANGEFGDTIRFLDWVYATMRLAVLGAFQSNPKIPYTDAGVDIIRSLILGVLKRGQDAGGFATTPAPTCTAPLVASVDTASRAHRVLPNIKWTAALAGAIHSLNPVSGIVAV